MVSSKFTLNRRQVLKGAAVGSCVLAAMTLPSFLRKLKIAPQFIFEKQKLMGTWVAVTLFSKNEAEGRAALADAFAEMREIDRLMSIHQSNSQVSELNRRAGNESLQADFRVIEVLKHAKSVSEKTGGVYDPTILPLMKTFGFYGKSRATLPSDQEIHLALDVSSSKYIYIDEAAQTVGLTKRGAALDLGSIGKGYALDRAALALRRHGIKSALIDAGGNLFAMGAPYDDPDSRSGWTVGIRDPKAESKQSYIKTVLLRDQAIGTSGVDENFVRIGQQQIGHLFNAVTGRPVHQYVSCSPITKTGMASDALSTAGYLVGKEKAEQLFSQEAEFHFFAQA